MPIKIRKNETLQHGRLLSLLAYDPSTGLWTRKVRMANRPAGEAVGCVCKTYGYVLISVDRVQYKAHRLAWFYVHGEWPAEEIDHINGVKTDNRIENLREANRNEQRGNCRVKRTAKSGVKGVRWYAITQKWNARIRVSGKEKSLGYYATKEEAAEAYRVAAKNVFGAFASDGTH